MGYTGRESENIVGDMTAALAITQGIDGPLTSNVRVLASKGISPRTLAEMFGEVANVKNFGARGDGTTDDTAGIQAAFNSVIANQSLWTGNAGGTVYFPPGRYKITSTISMVRGTRVLGVSREASQIRSFVTNGSTFKYLNTTTSFGDHISFKDISIFQDPSAPPMVGSAAIEVNINTAYRSTNLTVENVLIVQPYYGILLVDGIACAIRGVEVYQPQSYGIYLKYDSTNSAMTTSMIMENTYCHDSVTASGFRFEGSAYVSCVACAADSNNQYGYEVDSSTGIFIHGGAEYNGVGALLVNLCRGVTFQGHVVAGTSGIKDLVKVTQTVGLVLTGFFTGLGTSSGLVVNTDLASLTTMLGCYQTGTYTSTITNSPERVVMVGTNLAQTNLISHLQDSATAVASISDTRFALQTAGAKLWSWRNNTAEKASIDKDGSLDLNGGCSPGTPDLVSQPGFVYQGSGAPNAAKGNNGDVYFRTDTPGVANQRMYIRSGGAWTGIL